MKAIVAREVSSLVLKPSPGAASASSSHVRFDDAPAAKAVKAEGATHARYYGLITLNQITLSAKTDRELAGKLVQLYFEVFREILGEAESTGPVDKEQKQKDELEKAVGKVGKWQGRRKGAKGKGGKGQEEEEDVLESDAARLVAAVLTGIKRAVPYAQLEEDV
jgi:ribosome biogenesis protein MAK21